MKDRAIRRHHRNRVINKKVKLIKLRGEYWFYKYEGRLHKGKIHCSCKKCTYYRKHRKDWYYNTLKRFAFEDLNIKDI